MFLDNNLVTKIGRGEFVTYDYILNINSICPFIVFKLSRKVIDRGLNGLYGKLIFIDE